MLPPYLKPLFWLFASFILLVYLLIIIISPALGLILLLLTVLAAVIVFFLKPELWDAVRPTRKEKPADNHPRHAGKSTMMLESCSDARIRIILDRPDFTIGRSPSCSYVLPDGSISRQHCKITERSRQYSITDLGSTAGTYVNDSRLEPHIPVMLRVNNTVTIDKHLFIFKQVK